MTKCRNCERKVVDDSLLCCHCGYPITIAKLVPWPRQLWPVAPQQFWKMMMVLSLLLAILSATGFLVHVHRGLPCLYCFYPFALSLVMFFWVDLGSRKSLR